MRAVVLADLGFGDAGKGLLTDFFVRRWGAGAVVRYNGGAQAGHNVVTPEGRHHTFSQLGAGTFVAGVRTFLSRFMVVHPTALLVEAAQLRAVGVPDALERLTISELALVVTPYHQAAGRLRELARGDARHGSCGVGVGEAVAHALACPADRIVAGDLAAPALLARKLERIREHERAEAACLHGELRSGRAAALEARALDDSELGRQWTAAACTLAPRVVVEERWARQLSGVSAVVFEGAHGALLDQWHGFHPFTTWCDCTTAGAVELLAECAPVVETRTIGILRSHAVRHGAGPLPTQGDLGRAPVEHNRHDEWQGPVRYGWFDAALARYGAEVAGRIDALAITHLDWLSGLPSWTYGDGYRPEVALRTSEERSLDRQAEMTRRLLAAEPRLRSCEPREEAVLERIEALVGKPVALGSRGRTAADVFVRPGTESLLELPVETAATTWR